VFENAIGARASARRMNFGVPSFGDVGRVLPAIFALGATAVLSFGS
jgi:hypothetical protein